MDFHLLPQFCVHRPDGTLSPLLALDELPPYVQIMGIPRTMRQNVPTTMTRVATAFHPGRYYSVDAQALNPAGNPSTVYGMGLKNGMASGGSNGGGGGNVLSGGGAGKNGSTRSGRKKKVYCSYWIRHGECDYAQQGCMYKHEMPLNPDVLKEIGLLDIPRWYRDKHNVKSIHASDQDSSTSPSQDGDGHSQTESSNSAPPSVHGVDCASRPSISENHRTNSSGAIGRENIAHIAPPESAPHNSAISAATPAPMYNPIDQQGSQNEHEHDTVPKLPRIGTWGRTPSYSFENDPARYMGIRRVSSIGSFGQASSVSGVPLSTNTNSNGIAAPIPQSTPHGFPSFAHRHDINNPSRPNSQGVDVVPPIGANTLRRKTPFASLHENTSQSYPATLAQSQSHNGLHALAQSQAQSYLSTNSTPLLDLPYERFPFTRPPTAAGNSAMPGLPAPGQLQQQQQQQQLPMQQPQHHAGLHRAQSNMSLNAFSSLKRTPSFSIYGGFKNNGSTAAPLAPSSMAPPGTGNTSTNGGFSSTVNPGYANNNGRVEEEPARGLRGNASYSSLRYPPLTPGSQW